YRFGIGIGPIIELELVLRALHSADKGIVVDILIRMQHSHNRNVRGTVQSQRNPNRLLVRKTRQPSEPPIGYYCGGNGDQGQYKDEMAHAVEQHSPDGDSISHRKNDPDADDEGCERLLPA